MRERIILTREGETPPNAYCVEQGAYIIAEYSPDKPYLLTGGIGVCKDIVFYDRVSRKGLMCHLATALHLDKVLKGLIFEFGGDLSTTTVYVVPGPFDSAKRIAEKINDYNPEELFITKSRVNLARGVLLNLETGELEEIADWPRGRQEVPSSTRSGLVETLDRL